MRRLAQLTVTGTRRPRATALGGLDALVFAAGSGAFDISREDSKVKVLVIPTNEELEIARQTVAAIQHADSVVCSGD